MSGDDIPYQLRPNKFIDRQMFIELLSRLILPRGVESYVYVSMGGRHLVDHYAIYNQLGIDALYSFDKNLNEVQRQRFNRPIGQTVCAELNSADLPSKIDEILDTFPGRQSLVVWLDYTAPQRRMQFQEAIQTLVRLKHGDVFRITLNAHSETLCRGEEWRETNSPDASTFRAEQLRKQIEEYMPTDISAISGQELPMALARCVELAVKAAEAQMTALRIVPVLITTYRDGMRMVTVTCAVRNDNEEEDRFPSSAFSRWRFACKGWNDIQSIYAPILSAKEQNVLDGRIHRGPARMLASLKFLPGRDKDASLEALRCYKRFHRFYPTFRHVED